VAKVWQISALNELLEPMSTNIDSKMSKTHISPDTTKMMKKSGGISSLMFRETWTGANQRGMNRYVAAE
jgi:hypothetical protein